MRETRRPGRRKVGLNLSNPSGPNRKTRRWYNTPAGKEAIETAKKKYEGKSLVERIFKIKRVEK